MLLLACATLGLLGSLALGGKLSNLGTIRLRWPLVVMFALVVRYAAMSTRLGTLAGSNYVYLAALVTLAVWTTWHARQLPGLWLVTLGMAANLVVILANSTHMPVTPSLAPELRQGPIGQYAIETTSTRLPWLDDWIAFPLLPEIYSPGDIVVAVGMALAAFQGAWYPSRSRIGPDNPI